MKYFVTFLVAMTFQAETTWQTIHSLAGAYNCHHLPDGALFFLPLPLTRNRVDCARTCSYVKKTYSETCLKRPLPWETTCLLKDHIFVAESSTFQYNWTCHQRSPVLRDHISMSEGLVFQGRLCGIHICHCVFMVIVWCLLMLIDEHICNVFIAGASRPRDSLLEWYIRWVNCVISRPSCHLLTITPPAAWKKLWNSSIQNISRLIYRSKSIIRQPSGDSFTKTADVLKAEM